MQSFFSAYDRLHTGTYPVYTKAMPYRLELHVGKRGQVRFEKKVHAPRENLNMFSANLGTGARRASNRLKLSTSINGVMKEMNNCSTQGKNQLRYKGYIPLPLAPFCKKSIILPKSE
ncbi:hypothetical protein SCA6_007368 [Theobroma cacao]